MPRRSFVVISIFLCTALNATPPAGQAAGQAKQHQQAQIVENDWLRMRIRPNTPLQMAAFYEARRFPKAAIQQFKDTCFITVSILNKSDTVVWLELERWQFRLDKQPLQRLDRDYWTTQWEQISLPQANRSTFGWTLLPEVRNLQPHEPVGANIVLPFTASPFVLEARFLTGADKRGDEIIVRFDQARCAMDPAK